MKTQVIYQEKRRVKTTFISRCLVSAILVLVLFVVSMPQTLNALGETIHNKEEPEVATEEVVEEFDPEFNTDIAPISESQERHIEFEDVNRRTETEKHFYMSDGAFMREVFAEPIHFKNDIGRYEDIDNSLVYEMDGEYEKVRNANNAFTAEFAVNPDTNIPLMAVKEDDLSLEFYLYDKSKQLESMQDTELEGALSEKDSTLINSTAKIDIKNEYLFDSKKSLDVDYKSLKTDKAVYNNTLSSELRYKSLLPDVDFEYEIRQNGIKENIVVNKRQENYEYNFRIKSYGLYLKLWSTGIISAVNETGEDVFIIPAPFMFDAAEVYSDSVYYELEQTDDWEYIFTVKADADWINDEERAFPVVIDPVIERPYSSSSFQTVQLDNGNNRVTTSSGWHIRHNLLGSTIKRLMIKYTSNSSNDVYFSALNFQIMRTRDGNKTVLAQELPHNTSIGSITWSNLQSLLSGADTVFSISAPTTSWVSHKVPYGAKDFAFCFKFYTEDTMTIQEVAFQNFSVTEYYTNKKYDISYENEMFNLNFDVINFKQGLTIPYYIQTAPMMPIKIYGQYVQGFSALKRQYMPSAQDFYGYDWKLNVEQYMIPTQMHNPGLQANDIAFYTYIDENGNDIMLTYDQASGYYISGSGLEYNPSTGWLGRKGNRQMYHFDGSGRLDRIQNPDGQHIKIIYNSSGSILDLDGNIAMNTNGIYIWSTYVRLNYTNNLLSKVTGYGSGSGSQEISTFTYDTGTKRLTQATIEGRNVYIGYSGDKVSKISNHDGYGYTLTHSSTYTEIRTYFRIDSGSGYVYDYTRYSKSGQVRTAQYYDSGSRHIHTTEYILDSKGTLTKEIAEYVNYDGIIPPKQFKWYETNDSTSNDIKTLTNKSMSAVLESEDLIISDLTLQIPRSGSYIIFDRSIAQSILKKYKNPVFLMKITNCTIDVLACYINGINKGSSGWYNINDSVYAIIPLGEAITSFSFVSDVYYNSVTTPPVVMYMGIGELQSEDTIVTTLNGANKNAQTITNKTLTETKVTTVNTYGQLTREVTTNSKYQNYQVDYSYLTSNDSINTGTSMPNKNHLLRAATDSNGVERSYGYQINDYNPPANARGLVTNSMLVYPNANNNELDFMQEYYEYDIYGNLKKYTDLNGDIYNYVYEFKGASNLQMTYSDINGINPTTYTYDIYGKLKSMTNAAGTTEVTRNTRNEQYKFASTYYDYDYLNNGNLGTIKRSGTTMIGYAYSNTGNINSKSFANNQSLQYTYDAYGNMITKESYHGSALDAIQFNYNYLPGGQLGSVTYDGYTKTYTYPIKGQSVPESTITLSKSGQSDYKIKNTFDSSTDMLKSSDYTINGTTRTHSINYKDDISGLVSSESDGSFSTTYSYRGDNSVLSYQTNVSSASFNRTYHNIDIHAQTLKRSSLVEDTVSWSGGSKNYNTELEYDDNGNIWRMFTQGRDNVFYTYDSAGRIQNEENLTFNKKYKYEYDSNNNIKYVTEYNTNGTVYNIQTYNYSYDRLTSITNSNFLIGTRNFSTDALGNHINYSGFNLSWTRSRLLENVTDSAGTSVSFKYDENGIRYQKSLTTSAGASYNVNYYLDGTKIIAEERNGTLIHYYYNQTGVIGMRLNGKDYMFIKDTLGSITEIIDENGGLYAQYVYDAWGNIIAKTTGGLTDINPFRYRGYYMDVETSWYYLQTRYYDPVVRRFINADDYELISELAKNNGELNLFSYCNNNPIMFSDGSGDCFFVTLLVAFAVGAAVSTIGKYVEDIVYNISSGATGWDILKPSSLWQDYLSAAVTGGIMGVANVIAPGFGSTIGGRILEATVRPMLTQAFELASGARDEVDWGQIGISAVIRFGTSFAKLPGKTGGMLPNSVLSPAGEIISGATRRLAQGLTVNTSRGVIKRAIEILGV